MGLLASVAFLSQFHLVASIAALVTIGLGLLALQETLLPEFGQRLVMPVRFHGRANQLARRAGLPSLFVAGGLIGLCTVPCSGGVYLAAVALLSQQATYAAGLAYLGVYNVMFVAPLLLLLAFTTSRPTYSLLVSCERAAA